MKNKDVVSAVVGGAFFALPYAALSIALAPSLVIGAAAFGATELVCASFKKKETLKDTNKPLYIKISEARKQNKEILNLIPQIENDATKKNLNEIHDTVGKIVDLIEKEPKKEKKATNFFEYYLPVLTKITNRYDEIENQKLISEDGKKFIEKADKMIEDTLNAFKQIQASLYEKDIMDADAEMKIYETMLKADGIVEDDLLKKGSSKDEE